MCRAFPTKYIGVFASRAAYAAVYFGPRNRREFGGLVVGRSPARSGRSCSSDQCPAEASSGQLVQSDEYRSYLMPFQTRCRLPIWQIRHTRVVEYDCDALLCSRDRDVEA